MKTERFFLPEVVTLDEGEIDQSVLDRIDMHAYDPDLHLRRLLGAADPQPRLFPSQNMSVLYRNHWKNGTLDTVVSPDLLEWAWENARLGRMEAALEGRNRFATEDQSAYVWIRDLGRCVYCERPVNPYFKKSMQIDHLVPFASGGRTVVENLVCSCKECNLAKGAEDPLVFLDFISHPEGMELKSTLALLNSKSYNKSDKYIDEELASRADKLLLSIREKHKDLN